MEHYTALRKPLDPTAFIDELQDELRGELATLDEQLPGLDWVDIIDRGKQGPIKLTPLDAAPEPRNLRALKNDIRTRWGTVPLIDMLKEAVLRTGCLDQVASTAGRTDLDRAVVAERLLLAVYASAPPPASARWPAASMGTARTTCATYAAATSPPTLRGRWPPRSPTPPTRPDERACGAPVPRQWRLTPPTSERSIRTCSPSGTLATVAEACSSIGTWNASRWPSTPSC